MWAGIPFHMYYASFIIIKGSEEMESIQYRPLHLRDISPEKAENFIPIFLSKLLQMKQYPSLTSRSIVHPCTVIFFL